MKPVILGREMRRTSWGWRWRAGCVVAEIHDPVPDASSPHLESFLVRVFVYGTLVIPGYESSPTRAAALVTRKLRQIHLCLAKVLGE